MNHIVNGRELPFPLAKLHANAEFTITNRTEDFDIDANGAVAVIGDGLATLIEQLQDAGVLAGTTS